VGALVVAQAAVFVLAPRGGVIEPVPVHASGYFTPAQLDRARSFRRPQLALFAAGLAAKLAVLAWLVRRPPRWLPRRAVLAGAAISLILTLAALPLSVTSRARAQDVGLVTQSWPDWAADVAKSAAIGAVLAGLGAGLFMLLIRRRPRTWWVAGSALVVVIATGFVYAGPVVIDPVFNRFERLPAGTTRSDVLSLARTSGVAVGEVYVVDASRRTTAANAYVTGLGHTKRVVLYDTLLGSFSREETRLVVAHELAHAKYHDVRNALIFLALVAPAGMFAVSRLQPRTVAGLWMAIFVVSTPMTWISNQLSREVEARADSFALKVTRDPKAFISFERRIALRNVSDPDPSPVRHALLGTHPTVVQRIGIGKAYEARGR